MGKFELICDEALNKNGEGQGYFGKTSKSFEVGSDRQFSVMFFTDLPMERKISNALLDQQERHAREQMASGMSYDDWLSSKRETIRKHTLERRTTHTKWG